MVVFVFLGGDGQAVFEGELPAEVVLFLHDEQVVFALDGEVDDPLFPLGQAADGFEGVVDDIAEQAE